MKWSNVESLLIIFLEANENPEKPQKLDRSWQENQAWHRSPFQKPTTESPRQKLTVKLTQTQYRRNLQLHSHPQPLSLPLSLSLSTAVVCQSFGRGPEGVNITATESPSLHGVMSESSEAQRSAKENLLLCGGSRDAALTDWTTTVHLDTWTKAPLCFCLFRNQSVVFKMGSKMFLNVKTPPDLLWHDIVEIVVVSRRDCRANLCRKPQPITNNLMTDEVLLGSLSPFQ